MSWWKVLIHSMMFIVLFLAGAIFVNPLTDGIENDTWRTMAKESLRIGVTLFLLWAYARYFFKQPYGSYRIGKLLDAGIQWIFLGIAMPLVLIIFYIVSPYAVADVTNSLPISRVLTFIISSFIVACSAAVIEEFLFRGYLFKLFEDRWGAVAAIVINSFLFGALHLITVGDLQLVDVLLILFAGTMAGILFSLVTYKTGSVWNAVAVHLLWNFITSSKFFQFVQPGEGSLPSLVKINMDRDQIWVTGGALGIEASLPAIVLYLLIIGWIYARRPDRNKIKRELDASNSP